MLFPLVLLPAALPSCVFCIDMSSGFLLFPLHAASVYRALWGIGLGEKQELMVSAPIFTCRYVAPKNSVALSGLQGGVCLVVLFMVWVLIYGFRRAS